ncbi:MAG: hypothetical protein IJC55_00505, partial [Clostridia bacterium]|nr:hypothetical protein [Clostridia bacterium]
GYIEKAAVEDGEGANGPSVTDEWDRQQETDNSLVFKGSWTSVQYGIFTDGRAFRTSSPSATLSFTFNGTALQINSYSSPTQGSFDVVITDASGNAVKSATYSMKEDEYRIDRPETKTMVGWCSAIIVDLETEGEYTALITANGDGFLWIDAVDVLGEIAAPTETLQQVTVQESEFHGNASTDWQDLHLYQFSGEHALRTKVGGATLSLTFTGTQLVDLISYLSTSHGAVTVTLTDSTGTPVDTQYVDLTMGATGVDSNYQRSIFTKSGLDEAETYTITVTNAIDGKWCLVDAMILCGTNPYH